LSPNPTLSVVLISLTSSVSVSSVSIVDAFASPIKLKSFGIILNRLSLAIASLASFAAVQRS
jgi:hypothetical protein